MPGPLSDPLKDLPRPRINREPSPVLALTLPWLLVMLGSLSPLWPVIASAPLVPPLGFLILLGWLHLRPGLFPVWAGLPPAAKMPVLLSTKKRFVMKLR